MNYKHMAIVIVIILSLFLLVSYVFQPNYSIPEATKYIEIRDDGACEITEIINMTIRGSINGTYRDIPLNASQRIENISVETPGYYNRVELIEENNITRIKVWLFNDVEHTEKVNDQKVSIIYKYTFVNGLKMYDDVADFQYMSWGDQWDSSVSSLKTFIKIPGDSAETEIWNNPGTHVTASKWNANQLETTASDIPAHTTFEQRILMPTSYFKSTDNALVIHEDAKAIIEEDEKNYQSRLFYENLIKNIIPIIILLDCIMPLIVYLIYGRETKTKYEAEYEYDIPMDLKPVEVQYIFYSDVGIMDKQIYKAVILDLINNKYFKIVSYTDDDTIIRRTDKDTSNLEEYEKDLINYLDAFKDSDGNISLASISDKEDYDHYKEFRYNLTEKAKKSVPDSLVKRFFDDTGVKIYNKALLALFSISVLIFVFAIIFVGIGPMIENNLFWTLIILMAIPMAIYIIVPNTMPGKWTPEGKLASEKWENFKKYIEDYSLINEKPPASVQVWGKYLVYAAAFGRAKQATDALQKYIDESKMSREDIHKNNLVYFTSCGGYSNLNSSIYDIESTSYSDSGSFGSSGGGGFGGGGGGTY